MILSLMASWSGRYLLWRRCCQLCVSSKSPISADGMEREWERVSENTVIMWSGRGERKSRWGGANGEEWFELPGHYNRIHSVHCADVCVSRLFDIDNNSLTEWATRSCTYSLSTTVTKATQPYSALPCCAATCHRLHCKWLRLTKTQTYTGWCGRPSEWRWCRCRRDDRKPGRV